jgi:hypothetical protein
MTKQDSELASRVARYPSREGIDWMQVFDLDTGKAKGNVFIDTWEGLFFFYPSASDRQLIDSE